MDNFPNYKSTLEVEKYLIAHYGGGNIKHVFNEQIKHNDLLAKKMDTPFGRYRVKRSMGSRILSYWKVEPLNTESVCK